MMRRFPMALIWPGIEPGLHEVWLGGIEAARDQSLLEDNNIKTLVCCNPPLPYWRIRGVEYMVFDSNQVTEGTLHLLDEGQKYAILKDAWPSVAPAPRNTVARFVLR